MKGLLALSVLAAAAVAGAGLGRSGAHASGDAGTAIDRTLACNVLPAGVGAIQAGAFPKLGSTNASPANVILSTGTGTPSNLLTIYAPGVPRWSTGVALDRQLCGAAKASVPLTPRGLQGGVAPLGAKATCLAARQVFVHVHVVMTAKPKWTSSAQMQVARGKPLTTEVAVRSQRQKPLVDMTITGTKASFYSAKSCF